MPRSIRRLAVSWCLSFCPHFLDSMFSSSGRPAKLAPGVWTCSGPDGAAPTVRSIPAQGKPATRAPPWGPSPKRLTPHRGVRNRSLGLSSGTATSAAFPCTRSPRHLNPRRSAHPTRPRIAPKRAKLFLERHRPMMGLLLLDLMASERSSRPERAHHDGAPDPGRRPRRGLALGWYPTAPLVRKAASNVKLQAPAKLARICADVLSKTPQRYQLPDRQNNGDKKIQVQHQGTGPLPH
jgi:hypothetical protein